uniref:Uncharacterized protein n=1 Tax=Xenopus tropicalis TaxID=8364 RepID=A0A803JTE7_XENTR
MFLSHIKSGTYTYPCFSHTYSTHIHTHVSRTYTVRHIYIPMFLSHIQSGTYTHPCFFHTYSQAHIHTHVFSHAYSQAHIHTHVSFTHTVSLYTSPHPCTWPSPEMKAVVPAGANQKQVTSHSIRDGK